MRRLLGALIAYADMTIFMVVHGGAVSCGDVPPDLLLGFDWSLSSTTAGWATLMHQTVQQVPGPLRSHPTIV